MDEDKYFLDLEYEYELSHELELIKFDIADEKESLLYEIDLELENYYSDLSPSELEKVRDKKLAEMEKELAEYELQLRMEIEAKVYERVYMS